MLRIITTIINNHKHLSSFKSFTPFLPQLFFPSIIGCGRKKLGFCWSIIDIMIFNGSFHQHHIFYFVNISHCLIIFHFLEKITLRCHILLSFTMDYAMINFLLYMMFGVWHISIILIISIW